MNLADNKIKTPLYLQLTQYVRKGYNSLDDDSKREVTEFVKSCQHPEGGFKGRDERRDIYYSLFGTWIFAALDLSDSAENPLLTYNKETKGDKIDILASILMSVLQQDKGFKKPSLLKLIRLTFCGDRQISFYYRFFLFVLIYDALFKGWLLKFAGRIILPFFSLSGETPCTINAALLVARHVVLPDTESHQKLLLSFFDERGGFKSFTDTETPDLLSTAAALFALKVSGADLRILAPASIGFIQDNYSSGAFLAGNGDEIRDLEYTFYGLLALGTLL
ncbi:MAG: prenyltransferase/squalene oxidase repeat-containing protein [Prolixibacteraceae bacterium]|nr:prenyltransferase/squalene oxidase repeat-containing protein [Prolixibacteraceae bacterium]